VEAELEVLAGGVAPPLLLLLVLLVEDGAAEVVLLVVPGVFLTPPWTLVDGTVCLFAALAM
jgi:hypothetical protein